MDIRERLKQRQNEQAGEANSPNPPDGAPLDEPVEAPIPIKKARKPKKVTRTLYIGCVPRNGKPVYLTDVLTPLQQGVAEMESVSHYAVLDYGKGKNMVAASLVHWLDENSAPKNLVADRRYPCTDACLEVLLPHYDNVVERLA